MNLGLSSFIGYDITALLNFKKHFPKSDCEDFLRNLCLTHFEDMKYLQYFISKSLAKQK